jgi:thiol-disulfide isomerase/thioredoxin
MTTKSLEIAHITIDGKEIDEKTPINKNEFITQMSEVLRMFNEKKPMFIKFYAVWCGHCKTIDGPWKQLIKSAKADSAIKGANVAIVEIESKVIGKELDKITSGTKNLKVDGYPTIGSITYEHGNPVFKAFSGERSTPAMLSVVKELAKGKQSGGKQTGGSRRRKVKRTRKNKRSTKRSTKRKRHTKRKHI